MLPCRVRPRVALTPERPTSHSSIDVPEGVEVTVESRVVTVKGPRGTLTKSFKHLRVDMQLLEKEGGGQEIVIDMWFGKTKQMASLRTTISHINNLFGGVLQGYRYKMRCVYAHFPINCTIEQGPHRIEIRNFLGEKRPRIVNMLEGVTITRDKDVKDQYILEGNDIENVSRSCALIYQSCLVKKKDIRKFLDGIYVSSKGRIEAN